MEAVIQSFLAGFPVLMLHSSVTLAILVVGVFVYIKITPYDDIALIKVGNTAAAVSLVLPCHLLLPWPAASRFMKF